MPYSTEYLEFLKKLYQQRDRTIYAKVIALNFQELPLQQIEGRVTAGSINIDGTSAVRRTCSLTLVAQNIDYRSYYWGLNTKFKLEIGITNTLDNRYPQIIWFKQGVYLITSLNTSHSTNNFTMSIQGKDKMCQLNGEIGGSINAPTDFGTIEEDEIIDKGKDKDSNDIKEIITVIKKLPIKDIIRNAVHTYAGEPYQNIIINDLDAYGLELLEYRYDVPMYAYRAVNSKIFNNITLNGDLVVGGVALKDIPLIDLDMLVETLTPEVHTPKPYDGYYIAKIEYGHTAGYRETDLVYAGELIANVGESVTSVLDKIKNMLGEFEYFYDIDGRFVFQKKQALVNTLWTPSSNKDDEAEYFEGLAASSASVYEFNNHNLITALNNTPNLLNMKNDFSVWGEKTAINGDKLPVHLRYAIDTKPVRYVSPYPNDHQYLFGDDWRELIYIMALDYFKHNQDDDFEYLVGSSNPDDYPTGITGYEQYYTDIQGFWRQLYCPSKQEYVDQAVKVKLYFVDDKEKSEFITAKEKEYDDTFYTTGQYKYWSKAVYEQPETLNFWFDFLDSSGELQQFNVKNVGARTKPINDTNIKSIYFRETPDLIFVNNMNEIDDINTAYRYLQVPDDTMFAISSQGKSAKDKLDELIYKHSYCIETASITAIPIYHLQPNTRIHIYDKDTHLEGDYIISRMTIPLTYNGTMSITATKAAETLL